MHPSALTKNGRSTHAGLIPLDGESHKPAHLSREEENRLFELEITIRKNLSHFLAAGEALAEIKAQELYRKDFTSFEDYVRRKWEIGRIQAERLIRSSATVKILAALVDESTFTHETQVRPLTSLEPEKAMEAWELALVKADGRAMTAAIVRKAVQEVTPRRVVAAKPKRPKWAAVAKEAKSLPSQRAETEKALGHGKDPEAAPNAISKMKPFLEAHAFQRVPIPQSIPQSNGPTPLTALNFAEVAQQVKNLSRDEILTLSPGELARKLACNLRELDHIFRRKFGFSVIALKLEMRLINALSLLGDPGAMIADVAAQTGFKHVGLFKICFEKRFGSIPGECRREKMRLDEMRVKQTAPQFSPV